MDSCEVCGQNEYTVEDGFHYCVECGTKSQQHGIEMVAEFDANLPMGANAVSGGVIRIKKPKKKSKMLTSWEIINYIMLGYTDRLVASGAGEDLKLTVLQIWTAYLSRMEVAFFDKEKPEKPRFGLFPKAMDAMIIYNRKQKKQERKKTTGSSSKESVVPLFGSALTKKVRSEQRDLLNAEYNSFRVDQQPDVNRSLHELSVRSINASMSGSEISSKSAGQKIQFSRVARVAMKRKMKMSTGHIDKHESDVEDQLTCHKKKGQYNKGKMLNIEPEILKRMIMSSILGLALNASRSPLQLADLTRFYREGHIPTTNLMQFLPEETDPSTCTETLGQLQLGQSMSHQELQLGVLKMSKFLNVQPIIPDISKLCKRYLEELCLPADLMVFLDRLMAVFPPKMPFHGCQYLPNYEGRAMAYILFMLKLLFGCDDTTETKLSKSASKFNVILKNLTPSYRPLFVFRDWIRYLEMRKIILAQVHHPTNRTVAKEEGMEQDAELFVDYAMRRKQGGELFRASSKKLHREWMSKLKDFATNIVDMHHRLNTNRNFQQSIEFEPSLTPYRSYLEKFMLSNNHDGRIFIPQFMHENFSDHAIIPFVKPSDLKELLRDNHQITLKTKKAHSALSQLEFIDPAVARNLLNQIIALESPYLLIDECDEHDWTPPPKNKYRARTHENILSHLLLRNEAEREETLSGVLPKHPSPNDTGMDTTNTTASLSTTADFFDQSPVASQDIPLYQNTTHSLLTSNFDYWIRFYPSNARLSRQQFDEEVAVTLPESFRLVLEECARIIETHSSVLYKELMTVETYLFYAVQPVERFFDGSYDCQVLYNKKWDSSIHLRVQEAMKSY